MRRAINKQTIINLEDIVKKDLENYIDINDLDEDTTEELSFICNAFAKFYKTSVAEGKEDSEILKDFDTTIKSLQKGAFGTSFVTYAVYVYKQISIINKIYMRVERQTLDDKIKDAKKETKKPAPKKTTKSEPSPYRSRPKRREYYGCDCPYTSSVSHC